jgi:hypothetical protein
VKIFVDTSGDFFDENDGEEDGVRIKPVESRKKGLFAAVAALPASAPISLRNRFQKLEDQKEQLQLAEEAETVWSSAFRRWIPTKTRRTLTRLWPQR